MAVTNKTAAKRDFLSYLKQKGCRLTSQRRAIIDTVFGTDKHFTAEQLLEWSRQLDRSVSRATVYRTLPLLTESGLVQETDFGADRKFYDPNYADDPHHSHLICEDCGLIVEFGSEQLEQMAKEISRRLGFTAKSQRLRITARCEQMQRLGTCERAAGRKGKS